MKPSEEVVVSNIRREYLKTCCKPVYRVKWLKNKGAILIIIWSYLVTGVYHLLREGYANNEKTHYINPHGIMLVAAALLFPVGGWLADTHIERHKVIRSCMWIMWIGVMLATVSELLARGSTYYDKNIKTYIVSILALIIATGLGGFQSNIVQLGIAQLTDASSVEITSFITWYTLAPYISGVTLFYTTNCIADRNSFYIRTFAVSLCLTIALCLDFLLQNWLIKEECHVTKKSLSLIFKVIRFTIKHRHSFATEDEMPSRFDVAKHIHGGPFTNQQVEDVKSILHIVVLIATCSIVCSGITPVEYAKEKIEYSLQGWSGKTGLTGCYQRLNIRYNDYFFTIGLVFLYEFVIHPLFSKCLPKLKITSRFLLGMVLFLFRIIALLSLETIAYNEQWSSNSTIVVKKCIFTNKSEVKLSYKWLLIPGFMSGLSSFLLFLSAIEFIWAQTPYSMTGLALGTVYAFLGLNTILQSAVAAPFLFIKTVSWEHFPLTCGIWYFLLQGMIVLVVLIVGIMIVKKYKRRNRNDSLLNSYI